MKGQWVSWNSGICRMLMGRVWGMLFSYIWSNRVGVSNRSKDKSKDVGKFGEEKVAMKSKPLPVLGK